MTEIITSGERQTSDAAESLAIKLRPGSFIALYGELGAGKTAFTRGLAEGLRVKEKITSPTFTLLKAYESGVIPLYHFDMYRVKSGEELEGIGFFDYLESDGLCVVEWADLIKEDLPEDRLDVYIEYVGDDVRRIKLIPRGKFPETAI